MALGFRLTVAAAATWVEELGAAPDLRGGPDRRVECVEGTWSAPPSNVPTSPSQAVTDGAFGGIGALGIVCRPAQPQPVVGGAPVAPASVAVYMDLNQFRCPSTGGSKAPALLTYTDNHSPPATGASSCSYGAGGHVGLGWLGFDVLPPWKASSFSMRQVIANATVLVSLGLHRHDLPSKPACTLWATAVATATENAVLVNLAHDCPPGPAVALNVSTSLHSDGKNIVNCRLNACGQAQAQAGTPPFQWVQTWLGRGFQHKLGLPPHIDRHPLISRQERVAAGTVFLGKYMSHGGQGTDSNVRVAPRSPRPSTLGVAAAHTPVQGHKGNRAWSTLELASGGLVATVATHIWTARDFNFTREPLAAVKASVRTSAADPGYLSASPKLHFTIPGQASCPMQASCLRTTLALCANLLSSPSPLSISMPASPLVESFWYGALYMWATSNRANESAHMPPAGLWKNHYTGNDYPWPAYTTDINTQAPYFGCYSSNHAEIPGAMYQLNVDFIPAGRMLSEYAFGCPGVLQPVEIGARGAMFIQSDQGIRSNALLSSLLFIWHYEHTLDDEWLGQVGYPFLREVADFWSCYLFRDNATGTYHDLNDCCYEICGANDYPSGETFNGIPDNNFIMQHNPANSLGMLATLFPFMIQASEALDVDAALRPLWLGIASHLAPLPTAQAQVPGAASNATVLADFEGAGPPPKHDRQMLSCVQPVYPSGQVHSTMEDQGMLQAARDTLAYTDWLNQQPEGGSDGSCIMYTAASRLGINASLVYQRFAQDKSGYFPLQRNLMTTAQIGPAMVVYVNELFMTSHEAFVRIYPSHASSLGAAPPALGGLSGPPCNLTGTWVMPDEQGHLVQGPGSDLNGGCCDDKF
eukprot:gene2710-3365_t